VRVVIHHVGYEVAELGRSARFYDAVFFALGGRRIYDEGGAIGWGMDAPVLWVTARTRPRPGYGHVALAAAGRPAVEAAWEAGIAAGGADDGQPGPRPENGPSYFAAYLRDPDGLKVELCTGA
jgi:catechol 2,3-dioxygenase-like lactoylglutathione lyase family enzyme